MLDGNSGEVLNGSPDVETPVRKTVPIRDAFPIDPKVRAKQFATALVNGEIPTKMDKNAWDGVNRAEPGFVVSHKVKASELIKAGKNPADFFGPDGTAVSREDLRPEDAKFLDDLIGTKRREEAIERFYMKDQDEAVSRYYADEFDGVDGSVEGLELRQAIKFKFGNREVQILNFSGKDIEPELIEKYKQVLHWVVKKSGGSVLDRLHTVVFLPPKHESLIDPYEMENEDGTTEIVMVQSNGYKKPDHTTIVMSELQLLAPEERPELTPEQEEYWEKLAEKRRKNALPEHLLYKTACRTVAGKRSYGTLVHEAAHAALMGAGLPEPSTPKSDYQYKDENEFKAELTVAACLNEREKVDATDDDWALWEAEFKWLRDKEESAGRLLNLELEGVEVITLDITQGALPRQPKDPNRLLPVDESYQLLVDVTQ